MNTPFLGTLDVMLIHQEGFYVIDGYKVNLGILSLGASLQKQGFSVRVMSNTDLYLLSNEQQKTIFRALKPAIVGFYTMTDTIQHVVRLAKRLRSWSPASKIVAGGPLASAIGDKIASYFPFDYIVKGEGEYSLPQLTAYITQNKGALDGIPGLIWRDKGQYHAGAPAQLITDLDALPDPERGLVTTPTRLHISAGRGCPNSCTFCFQSVHGQGYRFRSAERVFQEIATNIDRFGYRAFDIIDDTFIAEPDRVVKFCELLKEYRQRTGKDFIWYCEARVDTLSERPELIKLMKDTGLIRLQVGIESGDTETLRRYGKRLNLQSLRELCQQVNELDGISVFGNFIIGGPQESEATLAKSLDLVKELLHLAPGLFEANTGFLAPYPATPIGKRPDLFGLTVEDDTYLTSVTPEDCYCSTPFLSRPQLRRLRHEFIAAMLSEMRSMLPTIPRRRLLQHYHWLKLYGTQTRWLSTTLQPLPAVHEYLKFFDNAKFAQLRDIPEAELMEWVPLRTICAIQYDPANWEDYRLSGSYEDMVITDPVEKDVYALSVGKLSLGELLQELRQRHRLDQDDSTLWHEVVKPMFQRLEDHFQVIFHE